MSSVYKMASCSVSDLRCKAKVFEVVQAAIVMWSYLWHVTWVDVAVTECTCSTVWFNVYTASFDVYSYPALLTLLFKSSHFFSSSGSANANAAEKGKADSTASSSTTTTTESPVAPSFLSLWKQPYVPVPLMCSFSSCQCSWWLSKDILMTWRLINTSRSMTIMSDFYTTLSVLSVYCSCVFIWFQTGGTCGVVMSVYESDPLLHVHVAASLHGQDGRLMTIVLSLLPC